ncbi:MAG: hypothetical protein GY715_13155 [Planctomycetes bacterium]|nr:hypothetical protein [Planctomycetota bacterium]
MDENDTLLGMDPVERLITAPGYDCAAVVAGLQQAVLDHCRGPSRTDDVTILCVDRIEQQPEADA